VFLYGGNDCANTVVPYGTAEYNRYVSSRGGLSRARADLLPITTASITDGRQLGLPKEMGQLKTLYDQGKVAIVGNVGMLEQPLTKQQYESGAVPGPAQLFSHSDQANFWQLGVPSSSATGWGGRLADLLADANGASKVSMCVSLAGSNSWQVGKRVVTDPLSPGGAFAINGGVPQMVPFSSRLSNAQIVDLASYVSSTLD
jgi:uncharacterized protein (DUF1501 family)